MTSRAVAIIAFVVAAIIESSAQACCNILPPAANDVFFTNATVNNPQTLSNQNVYISGTVNFNAAITMSRCTVFMCTNAILNVNNAALVVQDDLAGNRSIITGCTQIWQAIRINQGSSIVLDNCVVRDGIDGIQFNTGFLNTASRIENSAFSANQVAIQAQNITNLTFQAFSGNAFVRFRGPVTGIPGNGSGVTLFDPLPPFNTLAPAYGISVFSATGSIGTSGNQNRFIGLSTGINMVNSTLSVQNCQFLNCLATGWNGQQAGWGIYANNSSLTIQNIFSNNASCEFIGNNRGIKSDATVALNIQDAVFTNENVEDLEVGGSINPNSVLIKNNTFNVLNIQENVITVERALMAAAGTGNNSINIRNNQITATANSTFGSNVRMIELTTRPNGGVPTDNVYVADNTIDCNHGNFVGGNLVSFADGIAAVGNAFGCQIAGNTLNYNNAQVNPPARGTTSIAIGLQFMNALSPISLNQMNIIGPNNTVTSARIPANNIPAGVVCNTGSIGAIRCTWVKCAIHTAAAPSTWVCGNTTDNPFQGYHFSGNLLNCEFGRNTIGDGTLGVNFCTGGGNSGNSGGCGATTAFSDQDFRMNVWNNNFNYTATSGSFTTPLAPWGPNNNWRVDQNIPGNDPESPTAVPNSQPAAWYRQVANGGASQTAICDGVLPPPPGFVPEPPTGERAKQLVQGEYQFPEVSQRWDFERFLVGEMRRYPNSYASEPIAVGYFNSMVNTPLGQIARVEQLFSEATEIGLSQQADIRSLLGNQEQLTNELGILEVTEGQSQNLSPEAFQNAKTTILSQLAPIRAQIDQKNVTLSGLRHAYGLNAIRPVLDAIAPSNAIETNYKAIYQLYLKNWLNEPITTADSTIIRQIAYTCPETDGEVVTMARGMLPTQESRAFAREGEDEYCSAHPRNKNEAVISTGLVVDMMPNPANETTLLRFGSAFTGQIIVSDVSGKQILNTTETGLSEKRLDTSGYLPGLYFVTLKADSGLLLSYKFSVIH